MKKTLFVLLSLVLLLTIAFKAESVLAKNEKKIKLKIFVHHPAKGGKGKDKPLPPPNCTVTENDQINNFGLTGWQMPSAGLDYKINFKTRPRDLTAENVLSATISSFAVWNSADSEQIFFYTGSTAARTAKLDSTNAIFWKGINNGAIAITYVWYYPSTGELLEVDTAFNKNLNWDITDPAEGDCAGPEDSYDLINIGVHEFGHWVGLDDLYSETQKDLTMYGYGERSELKKATLGKGDISGVLAVAP